VALKIKGEENLVGYKFNKHLATHLFCKTCGVQSFYQPRSNPDGFGIFITFSQTCKNPILIHVLTGVMPHCIDSNTIISIIEKTFDGLKWEEAIEQDKIIRSLSKESEKQ
jgi:hypothetical protein